MSRETMKDLNQNTLIGFTEKRGHAWHYKASEQGAEPNHYPEAVPVNDVIRRLFNWEAVECPVSVTLPDNTVQLIEDRKAIVRSDNGHVMGLFKQGYQPHQYEDWLIHNVTSILNHETGLSIGSAGLLRAGAQAWVSVEVPDNVTVADVEFRPNLIACTSFDGTLATTYKRIVTVVVCDNTLAAGLGEQGQVFKARHSKYSGMKLEDAREALAIMGEIERDFRDEIETLTSWKVSDKEWYAFLDSYVPIDPDSKRSVTTGEKKRDEFNNLYYNDLRVAPWKGSAFGVLNAVNTYQHHIVSTRGDTIRAERNMTATLTDSFAKEDSKALDLLGKVTGNNVLATG